MPTDLEHEIITSHKNLDISYTQNRELSWLRFNQRVLEEAVDPFVPLLEQLKFIAIFTSNLDEFFMVRVGSLFDLSVMTPNEIDNKTLQTPAEQLNQVFEAIPPLMELRDQMFRDVSAALREKDIYDLTVDELTREERKFINHYYRDYIQPLLSPQIIDPRHPFPHLANKMVYIVALLKDEKGHDALGIIPVPSAVPPILPMEHVPSRFMRLETILLQHTEEIFEIYQVESRGIIAVTRNADISFDEEKFGDDVHDYRSQMSQLLKKRNRLAPVRLEVQGNITKGLIDTLCKRLGIEKTQVYHFTCPINMKYVYGVASLLTPAMLAEMTYVPITPRYPECLDSRRSMTEQIKQRDVLLCYPYEQMSPFLQLLKESAVDPNVVSIRITIYRLATGSEIAQQLCLAAENGKDVTVLMELRARFDEENNIAWSERLEQAGCRIIYGMEGYKCHSKICLITRREHNQVWTITQIGTGNYNEKTAVMYTDLCLLTANPEIGKDATLFFQNMMIANLNGVYHSLLVAPNGLKRTIMSLIDEEIAKGTEGRITIKVNSLTERDVIDKLSEASRAGVRVICTLRGICCLRPGIPGKTENIIVSSVVGRFLEHSRIYCFGNGEDAKIYISSADLMTRNITRRVEIACPIHDPGIRHQILDILSWVQKDNVKARLLQPDGTYRKKTVVNGAHVDCQEYFLSHSMQNRGPVAEQKGTGYFKRFLNAFDRL
jgi:polyphosphate kinase